MSRRDEHVYRVESLVGFTLDKLSNIKARLEALERTSTGPPNTFPIFGEGTPVGVSTPKPFEGRH